MLFAATGAGERLSVTLSSAGSTAQEPMLFNAVKEGYVGVMPTTMRWARSAPALAFLALAGCGGSSGHAAARETPTPGLTRAAAARAPAHPTDVIIRRNVLYREVNGVRLRLDAYLPAAKGLHPAVVFLHGGGFRAGTRSSFAPGEQAFGPTGRALARNGLAVFAIDYRLAPQFRFPAAEQDGLAAVRWVRRHAHDLGVDRARLGLFGVSAGGNLAVLAATQPSSPLDHVRVAVSWSGPMDLVRFYPAHPFVAEYLGCIASACPSRYRAASPVDHVDHGDPPMLLANSSAETVPIGQAREMIGRLAAVRVAHQLLMIPGGRHAGQYEPQAWPATLRFLRQHLVR